MIEFEQEIAITRKGERIGTFREFLGAWDFISREGVALDSETIAAISNKLDSLNQKHTEGVKSD